MKQLLRSAVACTLSLMICASPASAIQPPPDRHAGFDNADANHDGRIDRSEYMAARRVAFERMDSNHDGQLSRADFPRLASRGPNFQTRVNRYIERADLNRNGMVSRDEFSLAGTPLFDRADRNADGAVDRAELARMRVFLDSRPY